jgi:hypothetical protein
MERNFNLLADLADAEFNGESYNGSSLMATLQGLGPEEAAASSSFEGYSAWSIALHVAYCKWLVAAALLDGKEEVGAYPWPVGEGGFVEPVDRGEGEWKRLLAYLERIHGVAMRGLRNYAASRWDEVLEAWGIPKGKAAVWLCSHDSYHTAQIRNMGVPGLGPKKRVY